MLLCGTVDKDNLLIVSKGMNIEHRTSNKVFCHFINWRSDSPASSERFHYSMFTRLRRHQRRPGFNVQKPLYGAI